MLLTLGGVFLFNLFCGLFPCDPKYQTPEILNVPRDSSLLKRNIDIRNVVPVVKTTAGHVEGYLMKSSLGKDFFAFEGIPYAESTAGSRRWKSPVPKRSWSGIRQTKKPGPDCTQISLVKLFRVTGSENCLFINVYTPSLPQSLDSPFSTKLPVVLFIHGGSFILGSGSQYGPSYIMNQKDVVYVNFNYRLGPLGFLSTGDDAIPGNYGLKDQALAMKWVYENIEKFGGNRENVSLWGNSAGAVSAHLHLIANKTQPYFTNVFCSSSTAFQHWAVQSKERTMELTSSLGRRVGCYNDDSHELARCLKQVDSNRLVAEQMQLFDWFPTPPVLFSPVLEPPHPDAFLTISPEEAYKAGTVAKKPLVLGMTKDEGKAVMMILLPLMRTFPMRVMWNAISPAFLQYKNLVSDPNELREKIDKFYLRGESPRKANLNLFAEMVSDRYLTVGTIRGMQAHVNLGAPTYMYHFSFSDGSHNLANFIGYRSNEWGASHTEDMYYFFNDSSIYNGQRISDPDHDLSSIMINLMTNFAETGAPGYTESNEVTHFWEPITNPTQFKVLQFDKNVEMVNLPAREIERIKFWSNLNLPNMSLLFPLESPEVHGGPITNEIIR